MFVLPPPPRYPNGNLYTGYAPGVLIETNNTLAHHTGPEYQLVVGEGTYVLHDELHLATPPPHPSENTQPNTNPLATTIFPPSAGTKLSLTSLAPRRPPSHSLFRSVTANSTRSALPHSIQEEAPHGPGSDEEGFSRGIGGTGYLSSFTPVFGEGNPSLAAPNGKETKDPSKRRKPKNNIVKSNSSFVSRVIPHENLQKRLAERNPDGVFAFANINRAIQWFDLSSETKTDVLTKILFTKAHALCHDVNELTKSSTHIDVIIGFSTSDVIWYEPISQKYARINKNGVINTTPISSIVWLPNNENLFIAAHSNGTLVVYDKEKEDAPFVPEEATTSENGSSNGHSFGTFMVHKSVQSRNQKTNPVAVWKLSNQKINCIAFSPDGRHLAVASEDGSLRIIDYLKEQILAAFTSYYGGLLTVTWSPDGRYILTGGQDDLVSIWSFADSTLVARCQGHSSWVTDVKFDPWRCDDRNYRFGSIGEDCKLLLWDFSVGMLGRPKAMSTKQRGSIVSLLSGRKESYTALGRLRSNSTYSEDGGTNGDDIVHGVDSKASTAMLPPVMSKNIDNHPLSWLSFQEDSIMTASKDGYIHTWDRPKEGAGNTDDYL